MPSSPPAFPSSRRTALLGCALVVAAPEADFTGANFRSARMSFGDFERAYLFCADLTSVDARQANFRRADMRGVSLRDACLEGAILDEADMREAVLAVSGGGDGGGGMQLAGRSAEAAREIKMLISTSVEKVASGTQLVSAAGVTMSDIVQSVRKVADVIGEITAASADQSAGIAHVNQAIANLDQMTQQNAALVEESAAAAESLRDQADQMAQAVSVFKTQGAPSAPSRSARSGPPLSYQRTTPLALR